MMHLLLLVTFWASAAPAPASAPAAPTIRVSADPALPVPNLFKNAGLEQGGKRPTGWGVAACRPEVVDFDYRKQGGYRGAYLRIDARGSTSNGYLSQPVRLQPNTLYRAGVQVRLRAGTCVLWLHGYVDGKRFDQRAYLKSYGALPLVPDFVKLDWTQSPAPNTWTWLGREFRTWPGQGSVNPHFGAYFDRGSMDLDEPFIGLARTTLTVTVAHKAVRQVRLLDERGRTHWQTDVPAPPPETLTHTIKNLPTDTRYRVTVVSADQAETSQWYPDSP